MKKSAKSNWQNSRLNQTGLAAVPTSCQALSNLYVSSSRCDLSDLETIF